MKTRYLAITVKDGSVWGVPVEFIARNRAAFYASEFNGSLERSLIEDTVPLFLDSDYSISDWALNNMKWSDFDGHQVKIKDAPPPDFNKAWLSGDNELLWVDNAQLN